MISAIIIAKNEEEVIEDCLTSVSFCDEIIVVDAGSTDKTATIAKKYGAKVIEHINSDFSKARNFGLQEAKGEWVLYVDADERVSKELMVRIRTAIGNPQNEFAAYQIKRKNYYFGTHEWPKIERLERLFKKKNLRGWYGALHESPRIDGKIGDLEGFLVHFTHSDLTAMLQKTLIWSETEAHLRLRASHPQMTWWRFPRVMLTSFYDSFIKQKGYEVGTVGLIESVYQAFSSFVTYAKLWEMQEEIKNQKSKIKSENKT